MLPSQKGLSESEAKSLIAKHGRNKLPESPPPSDITLIISQLKNPLVYILLIASAVTLFLGEFADTAIILFAVAVNTILGFVQERKAQKALQSLKNLVQHKARVIRENQVYSILAEDLVPGDIVIVSAGDKVPADGRLFEASRLALSEAILTGESGSVTRQKDDRIFMGTVVVSGRGIARIEHTGANTEIGKIAKSVQAPSEETPLEKSLKKLGRDLSLLAFSLTILVFIVGVAIGRDIFEIFYTSVALAVSAIPEGLLVGLTVVLAVGMQRILKRKGLVRDLLSAETLGGVTTICVDKTGTLTEGKMTVVDTFGREQDLVLQAAVANDLDHPIVIAAYEWSKKFSINWELDFESLTRDYERLDSIPFSAKDRFFASLNKWDNKNNMLFINGAPEFLLEWSHIDPKRKKQILDEIEILTQSGKRVMGMARKKVGKNTSKITYNLAKSNLNFIGLVAYADPVRKSVKSALYKTKLAGIDAIVITGDYLETAMYVMNELNITVEKDQYLQGTDLNKISKEDLRKILAEKKIKLFARTSPNQKLMIVEALKENGEVVAMMGDGVNDAPALKHADIGIVVDSASDVAKETADLVLLDSNYETIVKSIEEGRGIYENIRKIILYLMSDAFGAIVAVLGSIIINLPLPVTAAQILWINLVSDGFPDLALTIDPKSKGIMKKPPRSRKEPLFTDWMKIVVAIVSFTGGIMTLGLFVWFYSLTGELETARSVAFLSLGVNTLIYVYSIKLLTEPFWMSNPFSNKWLNLAVVAGFILQFSPFVIQPLGRFFGVSMPPPFALLMVFAGSVFMFGIIEILKWLIKRNLNWFVH